MRCRNDTEDHIGGYIFGFSQLQVLDFISINYSSDSWGCAILWWVFFYNRLTKISSVPIGKNIQCWTIEGFTRLSDENAYRNCFSSEHYFLIKRNNNQVEYERIENNMNYAHLSSLLLGVQAFFFCVPHLIWWYGFMTSQINMERIILAIRNPKDNGSTALNIKILLDERKVWQIIFCLSPI